MRCRTTGALAAATVVVGFAAPAFARAPDLEWVAPPGCSSRDNVLDAVTRALGSSSAPDGQAIRARAVVEPAGRGFRVRLSTPSGERTLEADTCDELGEAVALILALAIDPARASAPPEARAAPAEKETPGPPAASPKTPPFAIGAGQIADFGTLPSAAVGAEVFAALRLPPIRIELAGAIWAPQRQNVQGTAAGGELTLTSAAGQGCLLPLIGRVELGACAGAGVDFMSASGFGPIVASPGSGAWTVITGEARAGLSVLPWLAVHAGLGLHVPLTRPSFVIQGFGHVHRPAPLSGRQSLAVEIRFP